MARRLDLAIREAGTEQREEQRERENVEQREGKEGDRETDT